MSSRSSSSPDALRFPGLIILVGAVTDRTDPMIAPVGSASQQSGVYAYREADAARKNIRKTMVDELLTPAVPYSLPEDGGGCRGWSL